MPHHMILPIRLRSAHGAEAGRRATWLELFVDLAFVAAVSAVGAPLATEYTPDGLIRYAFLFLLIWWAWLGHTLYATRFDPDDVLHRVLALALIFGVAVMAINADAALDSRSSAGFAAAYAGLRLVLAFQYARARQVRRAREFATTSAIGCGTAAAIWLASAVAPVRIRFALWAAALAVDLGTAVLTARHTHRLPPDAAHLPERFGLFTIILLGDSLVAVTNGMKTQETWTVPAASSALLGMSMAFTFWWWYFDGVGGAGERVVQSRQDSRLFHVWVYAHLPLYIGIGMAGVGAEHVIRFAPVGHLHAAEAWMLSAGLAMAMAAITTIAASRPDAVTGHRVIVRHYAVSLATLLLGTAGSHVPPARFLLALVALAVAQLVISLHAGSLTAPAGMFSQGAREIGENA
jgi:low temperature requirement protein LtrA